MPVVQLDVEERALSIAERDLVRQAQPEALAGKTKEQLHTLGGLLRTARDRSRTIARQQRREIRGKAEPRGSSAARDNSGSNAKTDALVAALKNVTAALRQLNAPTQADFARKALAAKRAAPIAARPSGRTASAGLKAKPSTRAKTVLSRSKVGSVSQAGKVAQARRDGGNGR